MLIKVKRSKISLKTVKLVRSENMTRVQSILGSYRKYNPSDSIEKIVKQIDRYSKG